MKKKAHTPGLTDWAHLIVKVMEDTRVPLKKRDPDLHYYECRHTENDWSQPCTVEEVAWANFWGTIVTIEPLPVPAGGVIEITKKEGEQLMWMREPRLARA